MNSQRILTCFFYPFLQTCLANTKFLCKPFYLGHASSIKRTKKEQKEKRKEANAVQKRMQDKINQLECELDNVKNSKSLKLGVALTAIPRKLKSRVKR